MNPTIDIKLDDFFEHNDCLIYGEYLDTYLLVNLLKSKKTREEFLAIIDQIPITEN